MVKSRNCDFCGKPIQPGKGTIYVKNDGIVWNFCTRRCRVLKIRYKKNPRKAPWTKFYKQG
ncbi:MAG: large subunit ribosomal protein L24e [Promethearchaeota archaeon CR_4]|nr:MAG: large subunit ribosomal protein L24e [Candidatus Lokiarchaeota archaeon CR_4]